MTNTNTPLTGDEIRAAIKHAHNMSGPSDATQPAEYVLAGALALLSKLRAPVADEPTKPRPPMCRIAGVSEDVLRGAAERHFKPPFDNCSFRMCDLPGQCRGEGKCHHPASAPVAGEALQQLVEELSDLASDMAYEANQEMDQEKASRAAIIERGEQALRRLNAAPQASEAQPAAYLTLDEEGSPCMLFFDLAEARKYCEPEEDPEPLFRHAAPQASESVRVQQLEAARFAYASEFPPDEDGDPDVGSIHANIRNLKARCDVVRNAALEEAIAAVLNDGEDSMTSHTANCHSAARIRALKTQADKGGAVCSCPDGDGSLRWPCAVHPPPPRDSAKGAGDVMLPPLPESLALQPGQLGHTDQTLDCFARAAVLADRQQRAALSAQPGAQKMDIPANLLERLRHHAADKSNTAFARSTMNELAGYLDPTHPHTDGGGE